MNLHILSFTPIFLAHTLVCSGHKSITLVTMNLEDKVLRYIKEHSNGVRVSDMEEPLGEKRMKLGFVANKLFEEGKVQKIDQMYFPV